MSESTFIGSYSRKGIIIIDWKKGNNEMKISKATKHFFKLLQQGKIFFISRLHCFWLVVAASPDNADQTNKEQAPGHQEWAKSKVEAANIQRLHNVHFANEGHNHGVGEEEENYILQFGLENFVLCFSPEDWITLDQNTL